MFSRNLLIFKCRKNCFRLWGWIRQRFCAVQALLIIAAAWQNTLTFHVSHQKMTIFLRRGDVRSELWCDVAWASLSDIEFNISNKKKYFIIRFPAAAVNLAIKINHESSPQGSLKRRQMREPRQEFTARKYFNWNWATAFYGAGRCCWCWSQIFKFIVKCPQVFFGAARAAVDERGQKGLNTSRRSTQL